MVAFPVSYTHLDVYKRQPLGVGADFVWGQLINGVSGCGPVTRFDASDLAVRYACEVPQVNGLGGGGADIEGSFDPVSYTHLDVYKRQMPIHLSVQMNTMNYPVSYTHLDVYKRQL